MPTNRFINQNRSKAGKKNVTAITRSQRSICNVVIYRWSDTDITKLNVLDATGEKGYVGRGQGATTGNFNEKSRVIIRNDVIRANLTKNKSGNSGQFSITLKRGKKVIRGKVQNEDIDYLDVIHPGDWIMIYMRKGGDTRTGKEINVNSVHTSSGFKMLGVIKNVRYIEVDDPGSGKPRLEYIVTGEDFGSVFDSNIFFNPILNQKTAKTLLGAKFLVDSLGSLKGSDRPTAASGLSADTIIRKLIGFYLGSKGTNLDDLNTTNQPWFIPPALGATFGVPLKNRTLGISFSDVLSTARIGLHKYNRNGSFNRIDPLPGGTFIKALPASGTVWAAMSNFKNPISNEMFTELVADSRGNLKPSVVLRQLPFSNRKGETSPFSAAKKYGSEVTSPFGSNDRQRTFFVDLPRHSVVSSDIKDKNVGKSEHERINHVIVVPRLDVNSIDIAFTAVINTASIQRYGLKTYQGQTQYIADQKLGGVKKACQYFTNLIVDWFFLSHQLYNGTIVIDGKDEHFELGNNLYISDLGQLYHIEGYTHTYAVTADGGTDYTTQLSVSRGQVFTNNTSKFIGPSSRTSEPTTITSSVLEGVR